MVANNVDPDQMAHFVASDFGLHCLPSTLLRVSRQEWASRRTDFYARKTFQCLTSPTWFSPTSD